MPEKGLNPYFIHADDSTGWPSGPHCRWPRAAVECIHCVVASDHRHSTTRLWKFNRENGKIDSFRVTCANKVWAQDGFARHDWLFNGGPAGSNADMRYEYSRVGWTEDESIVLDQKRLWQAAQIRAAEAQLREARERLSRAREALGLPAFSD